MYEGQTRQNFLSDARVKFGRSSPPPETELAPSGAPQRGRGGKSELGSRSRTGQKNPFSAVKGFREVPGFLGKVITKRCVDEELVEMDTD